MQIFFSRALVYSNLDSIHRVQRVEDECVFLGLNHLCMKIAALPFSRCKSGQEDHERAQEPIAQCTQPYSSRDQLTLDISS